ncbi:MAG: hypothetical protein R2911_39230 [Caldilineaceae bacterium]
MTTATRWLMMTAAQLRTGLEAVRGPGRPGLGTDRAPSSQQPLRICMTWPAHVAAPRAAKALIMASAGRVW